MPTEEGAVERGAADSEARAVGEPIGPEGLQERATCPSERRPRASADRAQHGLFGGP